MIKRVVNLIIVIFFGFWPVFTEAATLYFEPSSGVYGPGDSFAVDLKLNIDSDCINTVEANIEFPNDYLQMVDFLSGDSILSIWVDRPSKLELKQVNQTGLFHLAGGIPGGYCGRIPGDPGLSNVVGRLIFKVPSLIISNTIRDVAELNILDSSRVLINDGLGSVDKLVSKKASFKIVNTPVTKIKTWEKQIDDDKIPPEPFVIELQQKSDIYNGAYYIIFSTVDKQTGVDHFEILEIKPGEEIGVVPKQSVIDRILGPERAAPKWKVAKMPYLLEDQTLESIIKVKAIDKAGNERIVEYIPSFESEAALKKTSQPWINMVLLLVAVILFIISPVLLIKRHRAHAKKEEE